MARPKEYNKRLSYTANCEEEVYTTFKTKAEKEGKSVSELLQSFMQRFIDAKKSAENETSDWIYSSNSKIKVLSNREIIKDMNYDEVRQTFIDAIEVRELASKRVAELQKRR